MTIRNGVSGVQESRVGTTRIAQRVASCTDERRKIDIDEWRRDGLLVPGSQFARHWTLRGEQTASVWVCVETGSVSVRYRPNAKNPRVVESRIGLAWVPQPLGGERAYLQCPTIGCGHRACMLYADEQGHFGCRHCQHLAYRVQREDPLPRLFRRVEKLREKLGWPPGIANRPGDRPKWMRWKKYFKLYDEHTDLVRRIVGAMSKG